MPPAYIFPVIAPIRGNWKKRGTRRRRLFPLSRRGGRRLGVKRDICCEGEFRSIETSTGRRARFEKKPGMDISRGRMGSDVACFVDITYSGDGCFARESRGFTSRRVVNESTLICLPVLTYFFSIIHPSFVRKKETTRLEDDATPNRRYSVFFRPSGKQKSWTNEFVLEIFSAYPNIRGSDQLLIPGLVPSQLDSSSQGKGGLASVFARLRWNTVGSASLWLIQAWAAAGSEIRKNRRRRSWFPANFGRIGGPS